MTTGIPSLNSLEEAELVRQTMAGSRDAFAELVRLHQQAVRWSIARMVSDPTTMDDLAQEVFVRAYQSVSTFREDSGIRSWLLGIARNVTKEYIRSAIRQKERERGLLAIQVANWQLDQLDGQEVDESESKNLLRHLRECIELLAPESQLAVQEHYFENRTLEAMASDRGRSAGSLRMLMLRVRKALGKCIRKKSKGQA